MWAARPGKASRRRAPCNRLGSRPGKAPFLPGDAIVAIGHVRREARSLGWNSINAAMPSATTADAVYGACGLSA